MSDAGTTVDQHFLGKPPEIRAIYENLRKTVSKLGEWTEDPKKTSIHFNRRTAFIGVVTLRKSIVLTIKANREFASPRVFKTQQTSTRRWHHEVRLEKVSDIDTELTDWLREAYELSA